MKKLLIVSILTTSILMFTSCAPEIFKYTMISAKNNDFHVDVKITQLGNQQKQSIKAKTITEAVNNFLKLAGPDYDILVNGTVIEHNWIFSKSYEVSGIPVKSSEVKCKY